MWWKIGGGLLALAALGLIAWLYGGARYKQGRADERTEWAGTVAEAAQARLDGFRAGLAQQRQAEVRYRETVRDRIVPVERTIIREAQAYAQTPDGLELCLPAERVQLLEGQRSALFPAAPAAAADFGGFALLTYRLGDERRRVDVPLSGLPQSGDGAH